MAALALLLALASLGVSGWLWWQDLNQAGHEQQRLAEEIGRLDARDDALSAELDQQRQSLESLRAADHGVELAELQQRLQADRARLASVERSIEEQLALSRSLQGAADAMHGRLLAAEAAVARSSAPELNAGGELDLAEVDYLLRLANERLQLFSDTAAADRALTLAETHLDAMDNPAFVGVRREIAAARRALAQVDMPDYLQIAADLDGLQARIPALPFTDAARAAAAPADAEAGADDDAEDWGWWARLKNTFASLVTVRRSTDDGMVLSLQDKDYVRQRLWLQLEMAHLALMRRDEAAFRAALTRARDTLDRWFDAADGALQSVAGDLADLAAVEIETELPDITAPWNSLRLLRSRGGDAGPAAAAADPSGSEPAGHESESGEAGEGAR